MIFVILQFIILNIKPKYNSVFSAFVPIGNGCDNFCTYCVVPYARGSEKYRSAEEILEEVKILVKKGYKEIALIAQNVNSYKSDANVLINTNDADCESKKDLPPHSFARTSRR